MTPAAQSPVSIQTRAMIFDLDGVLVWTIPMHWWAFRKTFEAEGKDFSMDEYMRFAIGASRDEVIRSVIGRDLAPEKLQALMQAKERFVHEYIDDPGIEAIPGALEFVKKSKRLQLKTAVASASRTPRLLLESIGAETLFDAIVDRTMVERSKPDPDVFLLTAERLGVKPEECIVIEDSGVGVRAAVAAGMRVLALTTTHERHELSEATAIFESFHDIQLEQWL